MHKGRAKTKNYTERALEQCSIPAFVYMPRMLRPGDGSVHVKITPDEILDNHKRIAMADPIGWNIAVMNGQPIPQFRVDKGELILEYFIPDMATRQRAAEYLGGKVTSTRKLTWELRQENQAMKKAKTTDVGYEAMVKEAANELDEASKEDA